MKKICLIICIILISGCSVKQSLQSPKKEVMEGNSGPFKDNLDTVWFDAFLVNRLDGTEYNDVSVYVTEDDNTLVRYRYANRGNLLKYDQIVSEFLERESNTGSLELHQDEVRKLTMKEIGNTGFFYIVEKESDPKLRKEYAYISGLMHQDASSEDLFEEIAVKEDGFMYENIWLYFFSSNGDLRKLYIPKIIELVEIGFSSSLSMSERSKNRKESLVFLKEEFNDPKIALYLNAKYGINPKNYYVHLKDVADYLNKHEEKINRLREMGEEEFMMFMYIDTEMKGEHSLDVYQRSQLKKYRGSHSIQEILNNLRDYRIFY